MPMIKKVTPIVINQKIPIYDFDNNDDGSLFPPKKIINHKIIFNKVQLIPIKK